METRRRKHLARMFTVLVSLTLPGVLMAQDSTEMFRQHNEVSEKPPVSAHESQEARTDTSAEKGAVEEDEKVVVRETEDTVFVVNKSEMEEFACEIRSKIGKAREKGFGGGGGPITGLFAVSMRPVEDFIRYHPYLRSRDFGISDFGAEPFLLSGGMGYIGVGNGVRIGLAGMNGERNFAGTRGTDDSVMVSLRTKVSYFGFLLQKSYVTDRMSMTVGGVLGSGEVKVSFSDPGTFSAFEPVFGDEVLEHQTDAKCGVLEVHGGFSYSLTRFIHLGGDISVPAFFGVEGLSPFTDEFISVNPGARFKVIFGNLG